MTDLIGGGPAEDSPLPPLVFRRWVHSREEDTEGVEVYRPDGFVFPPAFGRDGFEMARDGGFLQQDIGPADGVVDVRGRWAQTGPGRVSVSFPDGHRAGYSFAIVMVDEAVLRIRRESARSARYAEGPAGDAAPLQAYQALPAPSTTRLLDFTEAQIITLRTFPPRFILRVGGVKPYANMGVELVPVVYIRQPEFWEIEVVGTLRGFGLPALAPYSVSLPLAGTLGSKGIEVVGATRRERFDVPETPASQGRCGDWAAWIDRQPPGPATLHVTGHCEFDSGGFTVELARHEPQGINPRDLLLDRIVHPPTGPATTQVTTVQARYDEETEQGFDTVTILPDGPSIQVQDTQ